MTDREPSLRGLERDFNLHVQLWRQTREGSHFNCRCAGACTYGNALSRLVASQLRDDLTHLAGFAARHGADNKPAAHEAMDFMIRQGLEKGPDGFVKGRTVKALGDLHAQCGSSLFLAEHKTRIANAELPCRGAFGRLLTRNRANLLRVLEGQPVLRSGPFVNHVIKKGQTPPQRL